MDERNREIAEMEAKRENDKTYSLSECSEEVLASVKVELTEIILSETDLDKEDILDFYVCGSFITGEALDGISDLDVRVQLSQEIEAEIEREIIDKAKLKAKPEDAIFGYVDVKCDVVPPSVEHTKI